MEYNTWDIFGNNITLNIERISNHGKNTLKVVIGTVAHYFLDMNHLRESYAERL